MTELFTPVEQMETLAKMAATARLRGQVEGARIDEEFIEALYKKYPHAEESLLAAEERGRASTYQELLFPNNSR